MNLTHPTCKKAPALAKTLVKKLVDLGYDEEEAVEMLNAQGTKEINAFVLQEQTYYDSNQPSTEGNKSITEGNKSITEGNKSMIKITVDSKGKTTSIENVDLEAQPAPAKAEPTKVEPAKPAKDIMYSAAHLSEEVLLFIEQLTVYLCFLQLPVLDVAGFENNGKPVFKVRSGQAQVDAWHYIFLTNQSNSHWHNMPALVVAPTGGDMLRLWKTHLGKALEPHQATYQLLPVGEVTASLSKLEIKEIVVTEADANRTPEAPAKAKAEAPAKAEAKAEATPASADAVKELATYLATGKLNLMKLRALVNKCLPTSDKLGAKTTKVEVTNVANNLLAKAGVAVETPVPAEPKAKTKAAKEPTAKAPTKADLLAWYIRTDESDSTKANLTLQFNAMDYNWKSSKDRAQAAADLGYTA
jgi:hypothetical protein